MAGAGNVDRVDTKLIAYLLARFACNNHTICDEELQVVGEPWIFLDSCSAMDLCAEDACTGRLQIT